MDRSDIRELEKLLEAVEAAQKKRADKSTHGASLLEFMCSEAKLARWLADRAPNILALCRRMEELEEQAACQHVGWKVCTTCGWTP